MCLVRKLDGMKHDGLYQGLSQEQHGHVLSELGNYGNWTQDCFNRGYSCGVFLSVIGSEVIVSL